MHILMMTNTYTPIVGGLERSVKEFTMAYRRRGHAVMVVAPEFEGMPKYERGVARVPAIEHFNGTEFSLKLPISNAVGNAIMKFKPDIIHAHHPFLMGSTALRLAHTHKVPIVFTHHTLFEQYTHYLPNDSPAAERFVIELATGFANLCDVVFAPSESVAQLIRERGVTTTIEVVPTGIQVSQFKNGDGKAARERLGVPADAFVVGHVGRLAPEKNLEFLAEAAASFLKQRPAAWLLVVGEGPSEPAIKDACERAGVTDRLCLAGVQREQALVDAYHAMDAFLFTSKSETQGLVVAEAMAAGLPVVGLDASGVRDVVEDGRNGRLLPSEDANAFAEALAWVADQPPTGRRKLRRAALATAESLSMARCATRALEIYQRLSLVAWVQRAPEGSSWAAGMRRFRAEWDLLKSVTKATAKATVTAIADAATGSAAPADATPANDASTPEAPATDAPAADTSATQTPDSDQQQPHAESVES